VAEHGDDLATLHRLTEVDQSRLAVSRQQRRHALQSGQMIAPEKIKLDMRSAQSKRREYHLQFEERHHRRMGG
jgi:hypothetical protein